MLAILGFPMVYALWLSLHKAVLWEKTWPFIGISNYVSILTSIEFYQPLLITLVFTFACLISEFLLGFAIALSLNEPIKGKGLIRSLLILPMMLPPTVVGLLWKIMLHPERGVINYYLGLFGLPQPQWLTSPNTALLSLVIVDVWEWTPFVFLVLLAGLSALPKEPFEAAKVDGATRWQVLRHITFPMMKRVILILIVLRFTDLFKVFDIVYTTTMGGPAASTKVISIDAYRISFLWWRIGYGAAYTQLIFIMVMFICTFTIKRIWFMEE
jgi:multiple sugar transport system permease protein